MNTTIHRKLNWLLIAFILLGAFLRWIDLAQMSDTLYHDEAFNGNDALSLLQQPRLTPFFDGNKGRESGWMYLIATSISVFDAQPVAMRLVAMMVGVLTLAALYAFARELVNERTATWSVGALAVLFWHVHLSRIALRAILLPLLGALAFAFLLRAYRRGWRRDWIAGGVLLGAMMYSYLSARMWVGYALVLLAGLVVFDPSRRKNSLLAMAIAGVLSLPLIGYTLLSPSTALDRVMEVGRFGVQDIVTNLGLWLQAPFYRGDEKFLLNLAYRPIFDPILGGLFLLGIIALPLAIRYRWQLAWLAGLAVAALLPSMVTGDAPHNLRAIGLVLPIALACGAGTWLIERGVRRVANPRWAALLPIGLLSIAGWFTFQDAHVGWFQQPDVIQYMPYENRLLHYLKSNTPPDMPGYMAFTSYLPILDSGTDFRRAYLSPRPLAMFNPLECWVASSVPASYTTTSDGIDGYRQALARWSEATIVISDVRKSQLDNTTFAVFRAVPRAEFLRDDSRLSFVAGGQLQLRLVNDLPMSVRPGDEVPLTLRVRPLRDLDRPYSVFLHLYRVQADGSLEMLSQSDAPLCISYPTDLWQAHEIIIQDFTLPILTDVPAGEYVIATGVYDTETGVRLPITSSQPVHDYFVLQPITVRP